LKPEALLEKHFEGTNPKAHIATLITAAQNLDKAARRKTGNPVGNPMDELKALRQLVINAQAQVVIDIKTNACTALNAGCFAADSKFRVPGGFKKVQDFVGMFMKNVNEVVEVVSSSYLDDYWYDIKLHDVSNMITKLSDPDFRYLFDLTTDKPKVWLIRYIEAVGKDDSQRSAKAIEQIILNDDDDDIFVIGADALQSMESRVVIDYERCLQKSNELLRRSYSMIDQSVIRRFIQALMR